MKYRLAGALGGAMLMAGNLYGPLCIPQLFALLPLMFLILRTPTPKAAAAAGLSILAKMDHYREGPGWIAADLPIHPSKTLFSRFGHTPLLAVSFALVIMTARGQIKSSANKKGDPKTA